MKRQNSLLFSLFVVITLVMPLIAGNSISTPIADNTKNIIANGSEAPSTIEFMGSKVDPWGGVTDVIYSIQNGTKFGYSFVNSLDSIIASQLTSGDGYVSQVDVQARGMTPFQNGVVGPSMIQITITVRPIIVVPSNLDDSYITDLSISEAITLAGQVVQYYQSVFGVTFDRFMVQQMPYFRYLSGISHDFVGKFYKLTYMHIFDSLNQGLNAVSTLLDRVSAMGGFMDLASADEWSSLLSIVAESYSTSFIPADAHGVDGVLSLLYYSGMGYVRTDPAHPEYKTIQNSLIAAFVATMEPGYVQAVAGNETYSMKTHVGYSSNIKNKMTEVPSTTSFSIIAGFTPGSLTIDGVPSTWMKVNDQYKIPTAITLPGGHTIPANSTPSDIIRAYLSYVPRELALGLNDKIGGLDPTSMDGLVDQLWGSPGPFPDLKQSVLTYDWSTFPNTTLVDFNFDLLAEIMEDAGLTPEALLNNIDDTLADENPVAALVKAFVDYFDSYGMLDVLDNDVYADSAALESYLGTLGAGVVQVFHDLIGIDLPSSIQTRAGLDAFVQEHWDITLGALWTAMANSDNTAIKNAFHDILNATNLQEHITPYLMADLGATLINGIGFYIAANMDPETGDLFTLDTSDLELNFDSDPSGITFDGPYLVITKGTANRTIPVGGTVHFTITVHNYGSATAYDVKVVDGINAGLDGDREAYWTRDSLAPGETWTINYDVAADEGGLFMDMQALCVYFNTTLDSFDPSDAENWVGSSFYTWSAAGYQILVTTGGGGFWDVLPSEIFGVPTLYVAAGVGGVALIGVALLIVRRR